MPRQHTITLHARVVRKLEPIRTSARFRAILGCLLDQTWTEPRIVGLYEDRAGNLLAMHEGDCGYNDFIGPGLRTNLDGIARVAKLTKAERAYLLGEYARIRH